MKCPYCGAEVYGRYCEYCDSEVNPLADEPCRGKITDKKPRMVSVANLCDQFMKNLDDVSLVYASFLMTRNGSRKEKGHSISKRLFKTLEIPEDDSVYLIHDDTFMHSGKNGFAITSSGFHTKSLAHDEVFHISWEQFIHAESIYRDASHNCADGMIISYQSDSSEIQKKTILLLQRIQEMVRAYGDQVLD